MPRTDYYHQGLGAALDVVETFLEPGCTSRGVTEISGLTGLNKNRVFRILSTLRDRGYVEKSIENDDYRLGLGFLLLGEVVRNQFDLRKVSQPYLRQLADSSGDAAYLLVMVGNRAVTIDRCLGEHSLQIAEPIGEQFPLYVGASPKLLLAHVEDPDRSKIIADLDLAVHGPNTITDVQEMTRELDQIRNQGYSVSVEETEEGTHAVAAPIRDNNGYVLAGITIAMPMMRYSKGTESRNIKLVLEAGRQISEKLGYQANS